MALEPLEKLGLRIELEPLEKPIGRDEELWKLELEPPKLRTLLPWEPDDRKLPL
jgi:hypothetical protein